MKIVQKRFEDCPKAIRLPFRPADEEICAVCSQPAGEDAEILSIDLESRLWINSFVFKAEVYSGHDTSMMIRSY